MIDRDLFFPCGCLKKYPFSRRHHSIILNQAFQDFGHTLPNDESSRDLFPLPQREFVL